MTGEFWQSSGLTGEFWQSSGRARLWNLHVKQRVEKKTDEWPHALAQKISPVQEKDTCSGQPARAVTGDASHSRDILVVSYLWASIERVVGRLEWSGEKSTRLGLAVRCLLGSKTRPSTLSKFSSDVARAPGLVLGPNGPKWRLFPRRGGASTATARRAPSV